MVCYQMKCVYFLKNKKYPTSYCFSNPKRNWTKITFNVIIIHEVYFYSEGRDVRVIKGVTCSTAYLAATAYSSHLNIKTTSPLPHGGDVNTDDNQKLPLVGARYSVYQALHQLRRRLSDVANHCNLSFCWWFFRLSNHVNVHVNESTEPFHRNAEITGFWTGEKLLFDWSCI